MKSVKPSKDVLEQAHTHNQCIKDDPDGPLLKKVVGVFELSCLNCLLLDVIERYW